MVQKSGDHQLRLVVYSIIHRGLGYIQNHPNGGWPWDFSEPSTVVSELGNQVASMFGGVLWAATLKPRRPKRGGVAIFCLMMTVVSSSCETVSVISFPLSIWMNDIININDMLCFDLIQLRLLPLFFVALY